MFTKQKSSAARHLGRRVGLALAWTLLSAAAQAGIVYSESSAPSGDFSNAGSAPTQIGNLGPGSNQIFGITGIGASGLDRDFFTLDVPAGWQLSSLTVLPGTAVGVAVSFLGVQQGTQVTSTSSAASLLGWVHYGDFDIDKDVLPRMGTGPGAIGFTGPLPSGQYAFWIQEFDDSGIAYGFDLTVTAVPEASAYALLAAGLVAVVALRRRRRSQIA